MPTAAQKRRTEKFNREHAYINVAVTQKQKDALAAEAQRREITISDLVRRQLRRYWK